MLLSFLPDAGRLAGLAFAVRGLFMRPAGRAVPLSNEPKAGWRSLYCVCVWQMLTRDIVPCCVCICMRAADYVKEHGPFLQDVSRPQHQAAYGPGGVGALCCCVCQWGIVGCWRNREKAEDAVAADALCTCWCFLLLCFAL